MNRTKNTPWLLLTIGAGFLALTTWSIYQARQGTSDVTDRDYYSHGLRYNETLLEKKAAEALGWSLESRLDNRTLIVTLTDRANQPIRGARGVLTMHLPGTSSSSSLHFQEIRAGVYQFQLTRSMTGEITARLDFERDGVRIHRQLLLSLK